MTRCWQRRSTSCWASCEISRRCSVPKALGSCFGRLNAALAALRPPRIFAKKEGVKQGCCAGPKVPLTPSLATLGSPVGQPVEIGQLVEVAADREGRTGLVIDHLPAALLALFARIASIGAPLVGGDEGGIADLLPMGEIDEMRRQIRKGPCNNVDDEIFT